MKGKTGLQLRRMVSWDDLQGYKGLYEQGSDPDAKLCSYHATKEKPARGDMPPLGVEMTPVLDFWGGAIGEGREWENIVAARWLAENDWRIRYCRLLLDVQHCPYDRSPIFIGHREGRPLWTYSDSGADTSGLSGPCDALGVWTVNSTQHSVRLPARFIKHWLNAEKILDAGEVATKWMLYSREISMAAAIWEEMKAVLENLPETVRGQKTIRSASTGGKTNARQKKAVSDAIISEMERLMSRGMTKSSSARIAYNKGFGSSPAANVKLFDRHRANIRDPKN